MTVTIEPSQLSGRVPAPPSKSMAHRLLICAGLASAGDGTSLIRNVALSQDILATCDCLRALGADVRICGYGNASPGSAAADEYDQQDAIYGSDDQASDDSDKVPPSDHSYVDIEVAGTDPREAAAAEFSCRESGSTLRFFTPLLALSGSDMTLTGTAKLMSRPLTVYEDIFRDSGIMFERSSSADAGSYADNAAIRTDNHVSDSCSGLGTRYNDRLRVKGSLSSGQYSMDGSISSQFISGMLFALPLLYGDSTIQLIPPVESRSYINMTILALSEFGVNVYWKDDNTIVIPGSQQYKARDIAVEGDWSNAAFFLAMGLGAGGLDPSSLQGDRVCAEYFALLENECAVVDIADCPDLGPVLMAYAAMHHGAVLTGTRRLRIKESDRGEAMREELAKFGITAIVDENTITVGSGISKPQVALNGHNDHRIVMSLALLCTMVGGTIEGAEAVSKSFPDFFERLRGAGAIIH